MDEYGAERCWKLHLCFKKSKTYVIQYEKILPGICDWRECVVSQHMTQTWEPALTGEDKKKKKNTPQLL